MKDISLTLLASLFVLLSLISLLLADPSLNGTRSPSFSELELRLALRR
jgi:hypothetical protein